MSEHDPNPKLPPIAFDAIAQSLVWPNLLRAPAMALAPRRLLLGMACWFLILTTAHIADRAGVGFEAVATLLGVRSSLFVLSWALIGLDFVEMPAIVTGALVSPISGAVRADPVGFSLVFIVALAVWSFASASVARSTAFQVATEQRMRVLASLRYGFTGGRASYAGILLPLVILSVLSMLAWGLLSLSAWLAVPVFLLALVIVAWLTLHTLCFLMIAPALACERSDAMDAIQRSYAYLLTSPFRALVYAFVTLGGGALALLLVSFIVSSASGMVVSLTPVELDGNTLDIVANAITTGYAISLLMTGSTVFYMLMRRVCDEQDLVDIVIDTPGTEQWGDDA